MASPRKTTLAVDRRKLIDALIRKRAALAAAMEADARTFAKREDDYRIAVVKALGRAFDAAHAGGRLPDSGYRHALEVPFRGSRPTRLNHASDIATITRHIALLELSTDESIRVGSDDIGRWL